MAMEDINSFAYNGRRPAEERQNVSGNIKPFKKVTFNASANDDYCTSEAFKTLRTNLIFCGSNIKTVVITSTTENEGKSTIAAKLARSMAEIGKRTLLIDADMRKSEMLRRNMRSSEIVGLSDVLSGVCEYTDAVYSTQDPNFDVVFSGRFPPMPVELLSGDRLPQMLSAFKAEYDYIIIDAPPVGMVIDAAVIAALCDGAIFVVANKDTGRKAAIEAKQQLEKSGVKILGAVLNETQRKGKHYGSKYYKYKKYYK